MDWSELGGVDGTAFIDWLSNDIDDSSESFGADWHHDWVSSVCDCLSSNQSFG
jgi:hypothetical protein